MKTVHEKVNPICFHFCQLLDWKPSLFISVLENSEFVNVIEYGNFEFKVFAGISMSICW
jgi:hypothetical protein